MSNERILPSKFSFDPKIAYEIISQKDDSVVLALSPKFNRYQNKVFVVWFDTVKDRIKEIAKIKLDTPLVFAFETPQNEDYLFKKLTLEQFNKRVVPKLNNPLTAWGIRSEEQMLKFLMETLQGD